MLREPYAFYPESLYAKFPITVDNGRVHFDDGTIFKSTTLAHHLSGCKYCFLIAVTLGANADQVLRRLQHIDMPHAVVMDDYANRQIELACDELEAQIAKKVAAEGYNLTSRYSPGYGDFGLENQESLLRLTHAQKRLGITLTASHLLIPQKSVTAVIGCTKQNSIVANPCADCKSKEKCKKICKLKR